MTELLCQNWLVLEQGWEPVAFLCLKFSKIVFKYVLKCPQCLVVCHIIDNSLIYVYNLK